MAGLIAFLWRDYWGDIGVRVVDLGIDPTTRLVDVLISLLFLIGVFGPLLYVGQWTKAIAAWIAMRPRLAGAVAKGHALRLGKLPAGRFLFNRRAAHVVLALLVLAITSLLAVSAPLPLILVLGPAIVIALLASALNLDHDLPPLLQLPRMAVRRTFIIVGRFFARLAGSTGRRIGNLGARPARRRAAWGAGHGVIGLQGPAGAGV
jgi:hypothetical protein